MKKKKIVLPVFAVTLVLYGIAAMFILFVQYENETIKFRNECNRKDRDIAAYISSSEDIYSKQTKITLHGYSLGSYPTVFAITDSEGKLIVSSRPAFVVDHSDENEVYRDSFIVETYPYMDKDTAKSILAFVRGCRHGCFLCAEWLSVYQSGEEYIPVSALLYNANSPEDGKLAVRFTDYEPTFTSYERNGSILQLEGLNEIDSAQKEKYYFLLHEKLDSFLNDYTKTHENISYNGGGGFQAADEYQYEGHQEINGVKFCVYFDSQYDLFYKAFINEAYLGTVIYMGFLFLIMALIITSVLRRIERKNEAAAKSREAFVSAAAHELKTPLAVIANKSECILENVSPEKNNEYINSIYDESKRMSRMVKTLIEYNKLRSDSKIKREKEELSTIFSDELKKIEPLIQPKNITCTVDYTQGLTLDCHRDLLALALGNLLSNAVKFTPEGGRIELTAAKTKGKVRVCVFNSGSRISPEDAPHIWQELYSGDKARTRDDGSTGMGLAICRLIFDLHGFRYGFQNEPGGVRFWFGE